MTRSWNTRSPRAHVLAYAFTLALCASVAVVECVAAQGMRDAARAPAMPAPASLRAEIEGLNRAMEAAWARGDMAGVASFYADDGVLQGPQGQRVRGRAAIDAYWMALKNPKSWKLEVLDVGGSVNDAYQLGCSTLVQGGTPADQVSVSEFVVIWKRGTDGRLRIALDFYHF
jgi:ketosteroid isomerase-like protein